MLTLLEVGEEGHDHTGTRRLRGRAGQAAIAVGAFALGAEELASSAGATGTSAAAALEEFLLQLAELGLLSR